MNREPFPTLPTLEVFELYAQRTPLPDGRMRVALDAPGYSVRRTFANAQRADAYIVAQQRRLFPTVF